MKKKQISFGIDKATANTGFLLWQTTTLWQRGVKKELDKIGITHPQFVVMSDLLWLSKHQESVTQVNLSSRSGIDPMTVSAIIKILQRKNLISREEHHTDTRAKKIALTDEGLKTTKQAVRIIEKFDNRFFKPLDKKEKSFREKLILLVPGKKEK